MNLNVRIAAAAYAVPPDEENVAEILERERLRVESTLAPLTPTARQKALDNLGLSRVRVCGALQPYDLVLLAAKAAIDRYGTSGSASQTMRSSSACPTTRARCPSDRISRSVLISPTAS